ncbi:MAG: LamG domain-containing protein, partial [Bacteroidota bacterium]
MRVLKQRGNIMESYRVPRIIKVLIACILLTATNVCLHAQDFYAYYTKVEKGESWEAIDRNTEHPDIIVKVAGGQIVFWRGTSFLPIWETADRSWTFEEVIERSGDGPEERPDATNSFSSVRLISSDENEIVVHWRYLPKFSAGNPKQEVDPLTFVDEYYFISSNGEVLRTIKQGNSKADDWLSDRNVKQQRVRLNAEGVNVLSSETVSPDFKPTPVIYTATKQGPDNDPVIHLRFDEGDENITRDDVSESELEVEGQRAYWKQGVSATCLAFDSYTSKISIPRTSASIIDEFSLEAWVALGAYPFNWAPIIQQTEYGKSGFYFGVGPAGKIMLSLQTGSWNSLVTDFELPLRKWVHVVASFSDGIASIYVDGEQVANETFKGALQPAGEDFVIGFNSHKQIPGDPVRPDCHECHTPVLFGFDGLIDEVKILDKGLTADEIYDSFLLLSPDQSVIKNPDLQPRVLPTGPKTGEFMAHYSSLNYYDTWDNLSRFGDHSDIVVEFDDHPSKFIFWRGMSYVPQVVNAENQWYNNQFNESWDAGGSWGEPMSDKQSLRSYVRIIENTAARKVIHWRYAQVQINGTQQNYDDEIGWGDWSDWYYFIYPDGVASKRMVHWSGDDPLDHEWQES